MYTKAQHRPSSTEVVTLDKIALSNWDSAYNPNINCHGRKLLPEWTASFAWSSSYCISCSCEATPLPTHFVEETPLPTHSVEETPWPTHPVEETTSPSGPVLKTLSPGVRIPSSFIAFRRETALTIQILVAKDWR